MNKHLILLVAACLSLASCATSKFYSQNAQDLRPMVLVQPYSFITDAVGDLSTNYIEEASRFNQETISELTSSIMPVETVINLDYGEGSTDATLGLWMHHLQGVKPGEAQDLIIPAALRNLVRESGYRYGLVLADLGYVKNAKQLIVEKAVGTGIALLEIFTHSNIYVGTDSGSPYENGVFSIIFDSQTGKVVWFGKYPKAKAFNPLDPSSVGKQLKKLYKDFR